MKRALWIAIVASAIAGSFALGRAQAQDDAKPDPMEDPAAWAALGKTGPEHAELKKMEGVWNTEVKSFLTPDGKPTVEKGTAKYSMVLGGRFLRQDFGGTMGGAPFKGIGYTGFDTATGTYQIIAMDSMGTGMMYLTGSAKDNVRTSSGHFFGPGRTKVPVRYETTIVNDDKQVLVMFMNLGNGELKSMEMTSTRAK